MIISKKMKLIIGFIIVFLISFFGTYFLVILTQSAYSTPSKGLLQIGDISVSVGPEPNSSNIPLDTVIIIDTVASAQIENLNITPEILIQYETSAISGSITYEIIFYPKEPLQPNRNYEVSATIFENPVSWSFATTSETFQPSIGYQLIKNVILISSLIAVVVLVCFSLIIGYKKRGKNKDYLR
jgi:hypothetical protein